MSSVEIMSPFLFEIPEMMDPWYSEGQRTSTFITGSNMSHDPNWNTVYHMRWLLIMRSYHEPKDTLFDGSNGCQDEGDFIRVHTMMGTIDQPEFDSRQFVSR